MNKTSGGSILKVDLLNPKESKHYKISNLKLKSGQESGITVSIDSLCLEIDTAAYQSHSELLSYSYDLISSERKKLHRQLSFLVDTSSRAAEISGLTVATTLPDDYQLPQALLLVNFDQPELTAEPGTAIGLKPSKQCKQTEEKLETEKQKSEDEQLTIETGNIDVTVSDSTPVSFTDSDFQFQTTALSFQLSIIKQPESGQLLFNNRLLKAGQIINRADLLTGRLKYVPDPKQHFPICITFSFQATIIQAECIEDLDSTCPEHKNLLIKKTPMIEEVSLAYSFNTGAGLKIIDDSGNQNHASLSGDAHWMTCRKHSGSTFAMNGTEGFAEIAHLETGGPMTIAAWVRFNDFNQPWSRIIDFGDGPAEHNIILSHIANENGLSFRIYDGDSNQYNALEITDFFQQEKWVHIAATIDNTGLMSIYRNGCLIKSKEGSVPEKCCRRGNFLGKSHWAGDGFLNGNIDDLLIVNHSLDREAVMAVYLADTVERVIAPGFYIDSLDTPNKYIGTLEVAESSPNIVFTMIDDADGTFTVDSQTGEIRTTDTSSIQSEYLIQVQAGSEDNSEILSILILVTNHTTQDEEKQKITSDQNVFEAPPLSLEFLSTLIQRDETIAQSIVIEDLPEGCELEDDFERVKTDGHPINISTWNLDELTFIPAEDTPEHFTASIVINNLDKKNRELREPELITLDINWPEQTANVLNIGRS